MRSLMLREWIPVLTVALLLAGCEGDEPRVCGTLEGNWYLTGFSDHGVAAIATGDAVFGSDGNFTILAEITFPDEPVDTLDLAGTWAMNGDRVTLTTESGAGEWIVDFSGIEATLTLVGPLPTNVIRLRRPIY